MSNTPEGRRALRLHHHLRDAVRHRRRATHVIAHDLAEMRQSQGYRELGYAGLVEYAEAEFGFLPGKTQQLALVGGRLERLPRLDAALATGALGWSAVRIVAQMATEETEAAWLEAASGHTCRELEELVARCVPGDAPPAAAGEEDPEWVSHAWATIRFEMHHYDLLMRSLQRLRQRYGDPELSMSQLLLDLAERELARGEDEPLAVPRGENASRENYRIIEHRCPSCERAWLETGGHRQELTRATRAMVECDAEVVVGDPESPSAGHLSRTIPPATRRAVLIRDGGRCQVPGCRNRRHLDLHHVEPFADGGGHEPENLTTVCTTHHDLLHRDVIRVRRNRDETLRWERGSGEPLAHLLRVDADRVELGHEWFSEFDGEPGKWFMLEGQEVAPGVNHVVDEAGDGDVAASGPAERFPRGWQAFRVGDEAHIGNLYDFRPLRGR